VNISERTATAMLYAIKSDTLFFNRSTNRVDLEAFSYLYPLADAALIRKMEGAEITLERLDYVLRAFRDGTLTEQVFCAFLGALPREDFIPYVADFFLQLEDVKWTIIAGIVNDSLVVSVRNLGYTKNAGEFVRRFFSDVGSAGGHRAMAKAVVPMRALREKFGDLPGEMIGPKLQDLAHEFLAHEQPPAEKKKETAGIKS
jgi:nanoRNase/pAp phosphatase (c-di-AMP/oligoRNAs hydrolase)